MPTFSHDMLEKMENEAQKLVAQYAACTALTFTQKEFIQAFIEPDHREKLAEVHAMLGKAGGLSAGFRTTIRMPDGITLETDILLPRGEPIVVPQYAQTGLVASAPQELVARVHAWGEDRLRVGSAAAMVVGAIKSMAQRDTGSKAMAVMVPALTTLLARVPVVNRRGNEIESDEHEKRAQRIANSKSIGELPSIAGPARRKIYEASQITNSLVLVSEAKHVMCEPKGARFHLYRVSGMSHDRAMVGNALNHLIGVL